MIPPSPSSTPVPNAALCRSVAFVVDAAGGRLYVDGAQTAALTWTGTAGTTTTTTDLCFGRYPGVAAPFMPGALDDVRVYSRSLNDDQVEDLYEGQVPGL